MATCSLRWTAVQFKGSPASSNLVALAGQTEGILGHVPACSGGCNLRREMESENEKSPRFTTQKSANTGFLGGSGRGIRTPDTRIMIPLL